MIGQVSRLILLIGEIRALVNSRWYYRTGTKERITNTAQTALNLGDFDL